MSVFEPGPRPVATGVLFDVIAVDVPLGLAALRLLRERGVPLGAVVLDQRSRRVGILVPPQAHEPVPKDELRCGPRQIGLGSWVVMPGADPDARVTWLRPPATSDGIADHLTPTLAVRAAIREAATAITEPEPHD
ncbi:hypothetical protein ACIBSV_49205 [Embleya sp. NPDC050154]|uniref:hypothetical protein n=1 Tax=Embleya sp. NPDC050154 TaxID=3363988 RepID=UPI00378AE3E7